MRTRKQIAGLLSFGAAVAGLLATGVATPANAAQTADREQIINGNSVKCASIPSGGTANGVQATQFQCDPDSDYKRWYVTKLPDDQYHNPVYRFQNVATLKCLTSSGGVGGPATQSTCDGGSDQKWSYDNAARLHNLSGGCLAVPLSQEGNGVKLIHTTCSNNNDQKWSAFD